MSSQETTQERYSFSKLSTYHTCLVSFITSYILKIEQSQNAFASYGLLIHDLLDRFAKGSMEIYDLLGEFENSYEERVPEAFPTLRNGKSMEDGYYEDAITYLSSFTGFGNYKILASEEKFEIEIQDFVFNGVIDLIFEDDDGNIVIEDHKSKKSFADEIEEMHYRRQLYLYSAYIKNHYGKFPTQLKFNMFRSMNIKTYDFKESDYSEAMDWMLKTIPQIRKLYCSYDFFFCNNLCGYKNLCGVKREVESNKCLKNYIKQEKK